MKYSYKELFTAILFFSISIIQGQISQNVDLFANVKGNDLRYSGSWSYVANDGTEYALLGAKSGTSFFSIEDANNMVELDFVPGPVTNWREITVVEHHAYVVTDVSGDNHSMQVIDLSFLPDSVQLITSYNETFTKGHIIQKDIHSDAPFVYVNGTSSTQGVHIINVSDPANPEEIGLYSPGYYIHDCHVRGNLMFAAAFYEGRMDIVDISEKANPTLITSLDYGGSNTHSSSLTEDGKFLIIADEKDGNPARIWNIEDLSNPYEVAQYSANLDALVHNPYVRGEFAIMSHNTEGMRIVDIADPALPVEVGFYDTYIGTSGGFSGLWSACPYFPSGKIIGGDRTEGLFVWEFNETRAGRFYGTAVDSFTQETILNPTILIIENGNFLPIDLFGNFKFGSLEADYTLVVDAPGYVQKIVSVSLIEGGFITEKIELVPENIDAKITGIILDSLTLEPIENASIEIVELSETIFSQNQGDFENILPSGDYSLIISANNFFTKTLDISLLPQDSSWFEIKLVREPVNSIFDISSTKMVQNYPNPFSVFTIIDLTEIEAVNEILILSPIGKIVRKEKIESQKFFKFYRKDLSKGLYWFVILNEEKTILANGEIIVID
jgi:choice-of-anchor B domain-containing protein